jgi:hypothetical protein
MVFLKQYIGMAAFALGMTTAFPVENEHSMPHPLLPYNYGSGASVHSKRVTGLTLVCYNFYGS